MRGHPDHAKIVEQSDRFADLADFVRTHPIVGDPAYKPVNSDPAGDMYLMDFLGMLVPLRAALGGENPRHAYTGPWRVAFTDTPACMTLHPFSTTGSEGSVIQNFNDAEEEAHVSIATTNGTPARFVERFPGPVHSVTPIADLPVASLEITVPARGRVWIQPQATPQSP